MEKLKNWKKRVLIAILLLGLSALAIAALTVGGRDASETFFNLSERDILLDIGESKKIELDTEISGINVSKAKVTWKSSKSSVATVEDGTVTAVAGGEAKITAIVEYKGKVYSTNCVVTVKSEENEYSAYKIRWYTQKKDRTGYDIVEETFERVVGSSVELTLPDAKKNLPANYVLNTEKSVFTGKVKESKAGCILDVYFDVAQITYYADYYYESASALGTYPTKETKKYTAYAFTAVELTDKPNNGFVINDSIKGTVKANNSVVAGSRLKVFCDRIRAKVTVQYVSGKAGATYNAIYGIGLLNAPENVFEDSTEYKVATYINGNKKKATLELMKTVTEDTKVVFKLDGAGFDYSKKNGTTTITNNSTEKGIPSSTILNGSSSTLYLSATYKTTGSGSNKFGITLRSGGTSREIRFSNTGVTVMKDNTTTSGILSTPKSANTYAYAGVYEDGGVYVWAQNSRAYGNTKVNSAIKDMVRNVNGGSYDICWAVVDGVLYASIEGETVLRLPLTYLDKNWTADKKYEIGFSSYDASAWGDQLQITNVKLALDKDAKELLAADKEVDSTLVKHIGYDAFNGEYLTGMKSLSAYLYGAETKKNTGVSATVTWADMSNTASAVGVTLKVGEQSIQYVVEGENKTIRSQTNHAWENNTNLTKQVLKEVTPFSKEGVAQIKAFVKDGYFYIMYNGVQAQCINMLSLFPDYTLDTKVSVGICAWDPYNGLAKFSDVKLLKEKDIEDITTAKEWGFYSQALSVDAYDFAEAKVEKSSKGQKTVTFLGANKVWQVEGTMNRLDDTTSDLLMGFQITVGDKKILIMGRNEGFQINWTGDPTFRKYADAPSKYVINSIASNKFFNKHNTDTRKQDHIDFKAVIYNDILYVWFTDVDGNTGLGWRIPLTDEQFGGYKAGSDYKLALYMADSDTKGSFTDLKVKMGYQVADDSIETIEKNVSKLYRVMSKEESKNVIYDVLKDTYMPKKGTISNTYIYGVEDSMTQKMTVKIKLSELKETYSSHGITIEYNNGTNKESVQFYMEGTRKQFRIISDFNWTPCVRVNPSEVVYDDKGECEVTAIVKDGVLYLEYGDSAAYKIGLNKLFPNTYDGSGKVRLGVCSWDVLSGSTNRNATFSDIAFTTGDKVGVDADKEYKTIQYLAGGGANFNVNDGVVSKSSDRYALTMTFKGASTTWDVKGTYKRTDSNTGDLLAGFQIKDANGKTINIIGARAGMSFIDVDGAGKEHWCNHYRDVESQWAVNKIPSDIFSSNWTDNSVDFRAVISEDIFYVWFDDILVWRVDLTKAISCTDSFHADRNSVVSTGFAKDSVYSLGFYMAGNANTGEFQKVKVKMGAAVMNQTTFITDRNETAYSFDEAMEAIETNVSSRASLMANASAKDMIFDVLTGEYVSKTQSANGGTAYIYGNGITGTQTLRVKLTALDKANNKSLNGITVQSGGKSAQFILQANNGGSRLMYDHVWGGISTTSWINVPTYTDAGVCNVTAVVKDATLYIFYNNQLANSVDLYKILPGYQESNPVQLGVYAFDAKNGLVAFSDIRFATGDNALNGLELSDANEWEFFTDSKNMSSDQITGECKPATGKSSAAYVYGVATNMPQMLTTTVTLDNFKNLASNTAYSGNGISIECGGQSVEIYIEGIKNYFRILEDRTWKNKKDIGFGTTEGPHNGKNGYDITAIVKDGMFYLKWTDTVAYKLPLTQLFPNYKSGDLIRLGVATWDSKNGGSTFTNVNFMAGAAVTVNTSINYKQVAEKDWKAQD